MGNVKRGVQGRDMDEEQFGQYERLRPEIRGVFEALCRYCDKDGRIGEGSLENYLKDSGTDKETLYWLNEDFGKVGLDFTVSWGTVPFADHVETVKELKNNIRGLDKKVSELKKELAARKGGQG